MESVVSKQKTKWMWEEKSINTKRNRRRKIIAGRFDKRHPVKVSWGFDEVNLKGENRKTDIE